MDDRRGRLRRRPVDGSRRPDAGYRTPGRTSFERLAAAVVRALPGRLLEGVGPFRIEVAQVPPDGDEPVLASFTEGTPGRLVIYRGPLEARAPTRDELATLLREVALIELATATGEDPTSFD